MSKKNHHEHEKPQPVATEPAPEAPSMSFAEPSAEAAQPGANAKDQPAVDPKDQENANLKDRLLRLQADFDNFRKRTIRDREDMARRAAERLLQDLLPIVDHFDLGLEAARQNHIKQSVIEGFEGILKQFNAMLEKAGVTPIVTKNTPFDPNCHECVTQVASEEHPEGSIIEETRKGYKLGTYILRASQVIVSTGPAIPAEPAATEAPPST